MGSISFKTTMSMEIIGTPSPNPWNSLQSSMDFLCYLPILGKIAIKQAAAQKGEEVQCRCGCGVRRALQIVAGEVLKALMNQVTFK